jgi:hypothetical protein
MLMTTTVCSRIRYLFYALPHCFIFLKFQIKISRNIDILNDHTVIEGRKICNPLS